MQLLQFAGDVALKVVAVDPDSGLNGDVYYSMVESPKYPGTEEDIFTINSNTGKTYEVCVTFLWIILHIYKLDLVDLHKNTQIIK